MYVCMCGINQQGHCRLCELTSLCVLIDDGYTNHALGDDFLGTYDICSTIPAGTFFEVRQVRE